MDKFEKFEPHGVGVQVAHCVHARDTDLLKELLADCDHFLACAARIGGISYFHEYAYDLLAENERITAAAFDAALHAFKSHKLRKTSTPLSAVLEEVMPWIEREIAEDRI